MQQRLYVIARRLWPGLEEITENQRVVGVIEVIGVLYSTPLALGGLIWLVAVTEAEDGQGHFFGERRLVEMMHANRNRSAQEMHDAVIAEIHGFSGDTPQTDDVTLAIVTRV